MPELNEDLHGMVPDKSDVALLLIDVINDLEFPGAELLVRHALPMADKIAMLKKRAKAARIPVIYVNDNFGRWQSDFTRNVEHCLNDTNEQGEPLRGKPLVQCLKPGPDDYFVLKPKHSAFFSTNLDILLDYLGAKTLILTGVAGNICVLFTANDAYMRDFRIIVPADCIASNEIEDNNTALHLMETVLKAEIKPSEEIDFSA
ncbi:MAG TPA: isochorismatase family cysteine hydrolase, partial [Abditibacteriaceae bacterium]